MRTPALASTTTPLGSALLIDSWNHFSRPTPFLTSTSASAISAMSPGDGSYACGSTLAFSTPKTRTCTPPTISAKSVSWVVVVTTSIVPGRPEALFDVSLHADAAATPQTRMRTMHDRTAAH